MLNAETKRPLRGSFCWAKAGRTRRAAALRRRALAWVLCVCAFAVPVRVQAETTYDRVAEVVQNAIDQLLPTLTTRVHDPDFDPDHFAEAFAFEGVRDWYYDGTQTREGTALDWRLVYDEVHAVLAAYKDESLTDRLTDEQQWVLNYCSAYVDRYIDPVPSDHEKQLIIHDYLCQLVRFDKSAVAGQEDDTPFTAYGALLNGRAVCQGFTNAAAILLSMAGIENRTVKSATHTWNLVRLDETYYHMDVTWDSYEWEKTGMPQYSYTNLTDEQIQRYRDHTIANGDGLPKANADKFHYLKRVGLVAHSEADIRRLVTEAAARGDAGVTLWISNHRSVPYDWEETLAFVTGLTVNGRLADPYTYWPPGADRDTLTVSF